jgi:type II secretory ATPase GspE/PulE/Tfp pilus assembly ATPase PilB-like protein
MQPAVPFVPAFPASSAVSQTRPQLPASVVPITSEPEFAPAPTSAPFAATRAPFPSLPGKAAGPDPFWVGQELLKQKEITVDQLRGAQTAHEARPGRPFIDTLLTLGLATAPQIAALIAARHDLKTVDLSTVGLDPKAARLMPAARARRAAVLPFAINGPELSIAVADPAHYTATLASGDFKFDRFLLFVAPRRDILSLIDEVWREDVPATNAQELLKHMASLAIKKRASDIHLEPRSTGLEIRFRIDGEMVHEFYVGPESKQLIINAAMILAGLDTSEQRKPQDGQAKITIGAKEYTFRVATLPSAFGTRATLRVLDNDAHARSFADQGLTPSNETLMRQVITNPNGIILVTGPTGSGKTTFLHCTLNQVHAPSLNIMTIEDPIEYTNPRYNQTQVNPGVGLDFAGALRAILRQDPDIILIGEARDRETAEVMFRSSLTGHLVFSTLHTNTAVGAIARLRDMQIESFLIGTALRAVTAQRLVRRLCPKCSVPHPHCDQLRQKFELPEADFRAANPDGCPACRHRGYYRRIGIFEIYPIVFDHSTEIQEIHDAQAATMHRLETELAAAANESIRSGIVGQISEARVRFSRQLEATRQKANEVVHLILSNAPEGEISAVYRRRGFPSMREDGIAKAAAGVTTLDEVFAEVL